MMDSVVLQAAIRLSCKMLPVLLSASIKVSVLLAFALAVALVMRGTRPALRRRMWLAAMAGSLFVFVLSFTGPLFHLAPLTGANHGAFTAVVSSAVLPAARPLERSSGMAGLAEEIWRRSSAGSGVIDAWPLVIVFLWFAGVLSGWLSIFWGRLQLLAITRTSPKPTRTRYSGLLRDLSRLVGVRRVVRIVESPRYVTPLTLGVLRPAIFLPTSMQSWPAAEKRFVLFHELHHVKYGDSFLLAVAYAVCSLFWFIPWVWTAYARLYLEQEKTCDAVVVESGVKPHAYASCILGAAHFSREPALPAGLSFSGRRKRVLKDRILSIVRQGRAMRHGAILFGFAALMLGAIAVMSATGMDTPGRGGKKYGNVYLAEYPAKTSDETAIVAMLMEYESAFTSHDLSRLLSLFAKDAFYHPCGSTGTFPVASKDCQEMMKFNFGLLKFEKYYDPRISVDGRQAFVKLLVETGDYLADYSFVLSRQRQGWMVSKTDYSNVRWKGYD